MTSKQVSHGITALGEKANVFVNDVGKASSAHDLRCSFEQQRLAEGGVSPRDLQKIMRLRTISTAELYYLRDDTVEIGKWITSKLAAGIFGTPGRPGQPR